MNALFPQTDALAYPAYRMPGWQCPLDNSSDFDEVVEQVGRVFKPHSMRLVDHARHLRTSMRRMTVGNVSLIQLEYGAAVTIEPDCFDGFVLVEVPVRGGGNYRCGGEAIEGHGKLAAVMSPHKPVRLQLAPSLSQIIVRLDQQRIDQACAAHLGYQPRDSVSFALGLDLNGPAGRAWLSLLRHVFDGGEAFSPLLGNPTYSAHIERMLIDTLLYGHAHNLSHRFALSHTRPTVAPAYVRRAAEYLEAHAAEPLSVEQLASAVGVSTRALFCAFRETYDQTPMGYLREIRLNRVRQALRDSDPDRTNLTHLAMQWGFFHYGRFARYYFERFGERPHETLRGARIPVRAN